MLNEIINEEKIVLSLSNAHIIADIHHYLFYTKKKLITQSKLNGTRVCLTKFIIFRFGIICECKC